ncbi:MAG: deoxyribose-phosphate aldolase [Pseudomonadota bacterium]|nr:deoxyribose-phosphate aldolase [Pseudomonadota bacterium]
MTTREPIDLDISLIVSQKVNLSAVERRCDTLMKRRSVKKRYQADWLLKAIEFMDLTTLAGDDTPGRVARICHKARTPVRNDILDYLQIPKPFSVAAVCVYPALIRTAKSALEQSDIGLASVATGFPTGLVPERTKISEINAAIRNGASEIDVVINRNKVLTANWVSLYNDIRAYKKACGLLHLKVIIGAGDLGTLRNVVRASWVAMLAGADFIKTSTGKEPTNATLPVSLVMIRAIRDFHDLTGIKVGFKAAGGISKAKQAMNYLILMKEELEEEWLDKSLFRIGASSLLADIERQLEHFVSGAYSSGNRHPIV